MKPKLFLVSVTSLICLSILEEATAQIRIIEGNNQSAPTGTTLSPFVVSVTQPDGDLWVGATMKFTIIEGSGSLSYEEVNTNHEGEAQTTLTLPDVIGAVVVQVQVKDNPPGVVYARLNFTATAFAPPIWIIEGNNQSAPTGTTLSPFVVSVTQPDGDLWVGATMKFTIIEGSGSLSYEEVNTNHEGEAQTTLTLPDVIGAVVVQVQVKDNPPGVVYARLNFTATAFAPPIRIIEGNNQSAPTGTTLSPFVVSVTQPDGDLWVGATMKFTIVEGSGSLSYEEVNTNHEGEAQTTLTLPDVIGAVVVQVQVKDNPPGVVYARLNFTATAFAPPPSEEATATSFAAGDSITFSIAENQPVGTAVGSKLEVAKQGNKAISFRISEASPDKSSFSVNLYSGQFVHQRSI